MTKIYAFANQKGGVGKTTTAVNLGAYLAASGRRVLVVDVDPQANATIGTGLDPVQVAAVVMDILVNPEKMLEEVVVPTELSNLDLAPSSSRLTLSQVSLDQTLRSKLALKNSIGNLRNSYQFILIDCPPSLSLLTLNALAAAREVIVPIQTHYYALQGVHQLLRIIELVKRLINPRLEILGFLATMYDARTNMGKRVLQEMYETLEDYYIFKTIIRVNIKLQEAASHGIPIIKYAKYSPVSYTHLTLPTN